MLIVEKTGTFIAGLTFCMAAVSMVVASLPAEASSGLERPLSFERLTACGTPAPSFLAGGTPPFLTGGGTPSDCALDSSNPATIYEPGVLYTIPVVVHIIMDSACAEGVVSDELVHSQIAILNEDFLALPGTNGALGTDARIRFELVTVDPDGQPTSGITRDCNTTWYNDGGDYWETLAWDPQRILNIYTNSAAGARGYVPFLPALGGGSMVGGNADRAVINWLAFGRNGPFPPHDQGRTVTHEIGHYLGLYHPYFGSCGIATEPECYSTGDLLCDTPPDDTSHDKCPVGATSCGGVAVPIENYMELTDDLCMEGFTREQARRMRCTLEHYRPDLFSAGEIFIDGFESGDTSAWPTTVP